MALELLVGAGGWDYYPTLEEDRLKAYAKHFSFVEVNTTFYHIPKLKTVISWRRRVPKDFTFSVKCNGLATHIHDLKPIVETMRTLETMFTICRLLRSDMLVLQTPPTLKVDEAKVEEVSRMLANLNQDEIQIFWEERSAEDPARIRNKMLEEGITPIVDLSREDPPEDVKVVYSRLFGSSEYSDEKLNEVRGRVAQSKAERVILAFHGAAMYKDTQRYIEHGNTSRGGIDASHTSFK